MLIKLLQETTLNDQVIPAGHILEIEDPAGQILIDNGSAILYTAEIERAEEVNLIQEEVEAIKTEKSLQMKSVKKEKEIMENLFGKAIKQAIDTKAVTSFANTEATPVLGQIGAGSKILEKTNKMNISGNLNVVYSGALSGTGIGPSIGIIGEATTAATTAPLMQYAAIPAKWFATVAVPNEYIDDVQGMESYVGNALKLQAGQVLDNSILNGSFTNNYGFKGIIGDANAVKQTVASVTAVTKTELEDMMAKVLPEAQDNAIWVMNPTYWAACQTTLLDDTNIGGQLITNGREKTLYGYPVIVTVATPSANPAVFGDFGQYAIGVAREMTIEVDRSVGFLNDTTAVKVGIRAAGGLGASPKYYNGITYGVMTYAGLSA